MKKLLTTFVLLLSVLLFGTPALAFGELVVYGRCEDAVDDLKNLRSYSFMDRVDTRVLKKRLGGQYLKFESDCQNNNQLGNLSYSSDNDPCEKDPVLNCTKTNKDFRFALFYTTLHQKANKELLKKHEEQVNKPCTAESNTLEETIKVAMGAEEPVKKETDILVDLYTEGRCPHWYSCWWYDVYVWEPVSARSTWANEHICTVGINELDGNGEKVFEYWFDDKKLMQKNYDKQEITTAINDINKVETNVTMGLGDWWCKNGDKCVIRKQIEMTGDMDSNEIDGLMARYHPQDYLKGLVWPFEIDIVGQYQSSCREHRIYPADDREHPLIVRECVKDASPKSPKFLDITEYHPAVEDAGNWQNRLAPLLREASPIAGMPPFKTEKEGYYTCYGDGNNCLVQGYFRNLESVVKVHIKDKKWDIERLPAIKDGKGTKADITVEDGVYYYGVSADDDTMSVVRIIPSDKPDSTILCKINGKEVTEAEHVYPLKPSEFEQITIAADASNVEVTCSITLTGSLQFSSDSKMSLWLDVYEDDPDKYQCSKNNSDYSPGKDGCEEVGMECLWCSYHNDALDFEGKPVDTGKPEELEVSKSIPKKDIPWGKVMGLLSSQKLKINGGTSTSVAMNNGAMYRKTFGANVAFVEEGRFICEDGTYAEICPCEVDNIWDTTSGTCVQDCGTEAKWSIANTKCECLTTGLDYNSFFKKCVSPAICDKIKNGAKYSEAEDACLCSVSHMALKGNECGCDASKNWTSDGGGGCMCAAGHTVKGGACVPDDDSPECSSDSDCDDGELCNDGKCTGGDEPEPLGGGCKSNSDCGTGMLCSSTETCECDIDNDFYPASSGAKACEYKDTGDDAVDAMCTLAGGTYVASEGYCEYNKSIAACKVSGKTWDEAEGTCSTGGDVLAKKGGDCTLVPGTTSAGSLGTVFAYLTMLGSILLVRARKKA